MSLTEIFCVQVLLSDLKKGEKECIYWDYLPPSSENNKIMPSNVVFNLFFTKSPSIYLQMKNITTSIVLCAPGWNELLADLFQWSEKIIPGI